MTARLALLDFDGPLLDVSGRYHRLHSELTAARGGAPLSAADYWDRKRRRVPERDILRETGLDDAAIAAVARERLERIETEELLRHDRLWPWSREVLARLGDAADVILVTQRSHPDRLAWQLHALGIDECFDDVVCGRGDDTDTAKAGLVRDAGFAPDAASVMVGDTEVDLRSARALGVHAVGVRTGIRADELLLACEPDALLDDLRDLPAWLRDRGWGDVAK